MEAEEGGGGVDGEEDPNQIGERMVVGRGECVRCAEAVIPGGMEGCQGRGRRMQDMAV